MTFTGNGLSTSAAAAAGLCGPSEGDTKGCRITAQMLQTSLITLAGVITQQELKVGVCRLTPNISSYYQLDVI